MAKPARRSVPAPALDSTPPSLRSRDLFLWVASLGKPVNVFRTVALREPRLDIDGLQTTSGDDDYVPRTHFMNWGSGVAGRSIQRITPPPFGAYAGLRLREVLRRSSLAPDIYFVRWRYEEQVMALAEALSAGAFWSDESESPANAYAFKYHAQFLDGGVSHFSGTYIPGLRGTWLHDMKAVRLVCYETGLPQPPRRRFEERVPSPAELWDEHAAARVDAEAGRQFQAAMRGAPPPTSDCG